MCICSMLTLSEEYTEDTYYTLFHTSIESTYRKHIRGGRFWMHQLQKNTNPFEHKDDCRTPSSLRFSNTRTYTGDRRIVVETYEQMVMACSFLWVYKVTHLIKYGRSQKTTFDETRKRALSECLLQSVCVCDFFHYFVWFGFGPCSMHLWIRSSINKPDHKKTLYLHRPPSLPTKWNYNCEKKKCWIEMHEFYWFFLWPGHFAKVRTDTV